MLWLSPTLLYISTVWNTSAGRHGLWSSVALDNPHYITWVGQVYSTTPPPWSQYFPTDSEKLFCKISICRFNSYYFSRFSDRCTSCLLKTYKPPEDYVCAVTRHILYTPAYTNSFYVPERSFMHVSVSSCFLIRFALQCRFY